MEKPGPSRGVASAENRDAAPIVMGGLSICDRETWELLSDCFYSSMKYAARSSAARQGDKGVGVREGMLSQVGTRAGNVTHFRTVSDVSRACGWESSVRSVRLEGLMHSGGRPAGGWSLPGRGLSRKELRALVKN